jgi:hypothetical protein
MTRAGARSCTGGAKQPVAAAWAVAALLVLTTCSGTGSAEDAGSAPAATAGASGAKDPAPDVTAPTTATTEVPATVLNSEDSPTPTVVFDCPDPSAFDTSGLPLASGPTDEIHGLLSCAYSTPPDYRPEAKVVVGIGNAAEDEANFANAQTLEPDAVGDVHIKETTDDSVLIINGGEVPGGGDLGYLGLGQAQRRQSEFFCVGVGSHTGDGAGIEALMRSVYEVVDTWCSDEDSLREFAFG